MKVTVIYDFNVEEIEDFSKDKAIIKCSFEQFSLIRHALIEAEGNLHKKSDYMQLLKELGNYKTKIKK